MKLTLADIQYFDPRQDVTILTRRLPHWSQAGTLCFITWRTVDSVPSDLVDLWQRERADWLSRQGIHVAKPDWRTRLKGLSPKLQREFHRQFTDRWNDWLDAGHGRAVLRDRQAATIVRDSLLFFDGDRYFMTDFVVMPTHVHVLAAFSNEESMLKQCESWKRFTAKEINILIGAKGRFWQEDDFDHLVRSEEQFWHFRRYIAANGAAAGLSEQEYLHFSKVLE